MAFAKHCHLIAVTGGKGGVGKSIFAANFALTILMESRKRVLLIDLDAKSCGDQNVILGIRPTKTVAEITQHTGMINDKTVNSLLNRHPSGLMYLAAVRSPDERLSVNPQSFFKQLEAISSQFDFIVVDLGSEMTDLQIGIFDFASLCMFLTTPEVLSINQSQKLLNHLISLTIPSDLFQIIVNKATKSGLPPQAVGKTLRRPVIGVLIQDDATTSAALMQSQPFMKPNANSAIASSYRDTFRRLMGSNLLQKMKAAARPKRQAVQSATNAPKLRGQAASDDPRVLLKLRIHEELIFKMDQTKGMTETDNDPDKEARLRAKTQQIISEIVDVQAKDFDRKDRAQLIKEVLDEAIGLGPLEDLLADDQVSEIMVNGPSQIFCERGGKLTLSKVTFTSNLQLRNVIDRILLPLNRQINEKVPYQDARLKDGSRVNAIIEPLAIDGASLTIRKFSKDNITYENYIKWGSANKQMLQFLKICVEQGKNIIISGGTGSGKTTLLNTLSGFIPADERIITVEDAAELQLKQEHVVRLETKPSSNEGAPPVTIRDLVRNTLRMRPDRIVVGECRGGEALDMLSAMNTGHDGSMTTVHSNSDREAIARLETLVMMAGMDLPAKAIREQIAGAVDLIVQISRLSDGSRKIMSITSVEGIQGDTVTLTKVFEFKETGQDKNRKIIGQFKSTGLQPKFWQDFAKRGVSLPPDIFDLNSDKKNVKQVG